MTETFALWRRIGQNEAVKVTRHAAQRSALPLDSRDLVPVGEAARTARKAALIAACLAAVTALDTGLGAGGGARAGGFEIPDTGTFDLSRGGAFVARGDDPTAIALNPGALTRMVGTHILYNHLFLWEQSTFTRQSSELPPGTDYGFDPLAPQSNESDLFPLGGMFVATSDFGLKNWTFAAGVYGPNAHGTKDYAVDGGQRYLLTHLDAVLFYPSLAIAYGDHDTFGIGVTFQLVMTPSLAMDLVVDGSQAGGLHAYYAGNDVEARISMKDMASFSAIVGAWWRPAPNWELGISGRVVPTNLHLAGNFSLRNVPGQTQFTPAQLAVPGSAARMDLTLPPTARIGARYRHLDGQHEVFDVELDVVYEAWSMLEAFDVKLDGTINLFVGAEAPDTKLEKRWKDTLSVRLGGTVSAWHDGKNELQVSLGGYWESGAVPKNYESLDFLSFQRFGIGLGVAARLGVLKLSLAYSHVFQEDRVVDERFGKVYQQRPLDPCPDNCDGGAGWSGVPANAGRFESAYDMLSAGLEAAF